MKNNQFRQYLLNKVQNQLLDEDKNRLLNDDESKTSSNNFGFLKWKIENMMGNTAPPPGAVQLSTYTPKVRSPNESYSQYKEAFKTAGLSPGTSEGLANLFENVTANSPVPIKINRAPESFTPEMANSLYIAQFRTTAEPMASKAYADIQQEQSGRPLTRLEKAFGKSWNSLTPEQRGQVLKTLAQDVPTFRDSEARVASHGGWDKFVKNLATSAANRPVTKQPTQSTPPEPRGMTKTGPNTWIKVTPYGTAKVRRVEKGK